MSSRVRIWLFALVAMVAVVATVAYAWSEVARHQRVQATDPVVAVTSVEELGDAPRIVFRHTGRDSRYGVVSMVRIDDPGGARAFTEVACDRVAAWATGASCLRTQRGVVTTYEAVELGADWEPTHSSPLPGIPSRTRVSRSGRLVATTAFVTGHSYMTVGFSTATVVRELAAGESWGNLEQFSLEIEGQQVRPVDRNIWGVTFVDDRRFYATVATGGETWLVEGDLERRTLTSVVTGAECPAISPDGTRVAYKVDVATNGEKVWALAVLDLATLQLTELTNGPRGVDDQVAWLNDDTLLYGLPRTDDPGVTDVWSLEIAPDASPTLLVEQAWSPTVVR